jgi:hypothetical protein
MISSSRMFLELSLPSLNLSEPLSRLLDLLVGRLSMVNVAGTLKREFCGVGRKGLSRVYILTELRAWPPYRALNRPDKKSGDWLECHMEWAMNIQEFFKEKYVYIGWPKALKGTETLDCRQFWWVGIGND